MPVQFWGEQRGRFEDFHVLMWYYDGPEIYESVGCYLLIHLCHFLDKNVVGLNPDERLAVEKNIKLPVVWKREKHIQIIDWC